MRTHDSNIAIEFINQANRTRFSIIKDKDIELYASDNVNRGGVILTTIPKEQIIQLRDFLNRNYEKEDE